jgi:predicted Fe-Mo cluster-binding NifX family protein
MQICIPIAEDLGLNSRVHDHFGSAPRFMIVDTESAACHAVENHDRRHGHGMCQPLKALANQAIDAIVVGGIGQRALGRLERRHMRVYQSEHTTVGETVAALKAGSLRPVSADDACSGHAAHRHRHRGGLDR